MKSKERRGEDREKNNSNRAGLGLQDRFALVAITRCSCDHQVVSTGGLLHDTHLLAAYISCAPRCHILACLWIKVWEKERMAEAKRNENA